MQHLFYFNADENSRVLLCLFSYNVYFSIRAGLFYILLHFGFTACLFDVFLRTVLCKDYILLDEYVTKVL